MDDLRLSILDIYYPGLSEALITTKFIEIDIIYLLKNEIAPMFGITDRDVKKIYKKLQNDKYLSYEWDRLFSKVHDFILGFVNSTELPEYYNDSDFRNAILSLLNNLVECRQLVAKIIRDNWDVKELIVNK